MFQNVLQNASSGKTRILVTHALHFLSSVDYVYAISDGRIAEEGTYEELMQNDGEFSKFIKEFGSSEDQEEQEKEDEAEAIEGDAIADEKKKVVDHKKASAGAGIMQAEERNTGAINWTVYKTYSAAGKGAIILPVLFLSLVLVQASTVMSSYWYVYTLSGKVSSSDCGIP